MHYCIMITFDVIENQAFACGHIYHTFLNVDAAATADKNGAARRRRTRAADPDEIVGAQLSLQLVYSVEFFKLCYV